MEIENNSDDEYQLHEVDAYDDSSFYDSTSEEDTVEEIASSSNNTQSFWSDLPMPALEKIYLYLNREDQCRMSLVCKTWSQEYGSPSIWRNVEFVLPEYEYSSGICPEVRWAQKYGHIFHNVKISCKRVRLNIQQFIWKQLRLFLQALIYHSQLSMLSFVNMTRYFRLLSDTVFEDVFQSIANLLLSQDKLTSIEFRNVEFRKHEASKILKIICLKHGGTLKNLRLEGFVKESSEDIIIYIVNTHPYYETLMNLQEIIVDYSQTFENIITACFDYSNIIGVQRRKGKGVLQKMKIICNGSVRVNYQGISSAAWKYFRKTFPALTIDLLFYSGSVPRNRVEVFLVPHMPVRSLNFKWNKSNNSSERVENEIGSLLQHIVRCESIDLLEELTIVWPHNSTNLARDLVLFLRLCSRLKILQLYIQHPVDSLDSVLKWWLENGVISLEEALINVSSIQTANDFEYYTNLADEYYPLLQVLGLNFILIVDSPLRSSR